MPGGGAIGRVCRVGTGGRVPGAWPAGAGTGGTVTDRGETVGRTGFCAPTPGLAEVSKESVGLARPGGAATGFTTGSGSATRSGASSAGAGAASASSSGASASTHGAIHSSRAAIRPLANCSSPRDASENEASTAPSANFSPSSVASFPAPGSQCGIAAAAEPLG